MTLVIENKTMTETNQWHIPINRPLLSHRQREQETEWMSSVIYFKLSRSQEKKKNGNCSDCRTRAQLSHPDTFRWLRWHRRKKNKITRLIRQTANGCDLATVRHFDWSSLSLGLRWNILYRVNFWGGYSLTVVSIGRTDTTIYLH